MKLKIEQHKIAREFFKKLKHNFDLSNLKSWGTSYDYDGWTFSLTGDLFTHVCGIYYGDEHGNVYIRPDLITRMKIHSFLRKQKRKKRKNERHEMLIRELEPTKIQIEQTFSRPVTEIYESLNNHD